MRGEAKAKLGGWWWNDRAEPAHVMVNRTGIRRRDLSRLLRDKCVRQEVMKQRG